jgi:hypothetical protein
LTASPRVGKLAAALTTSEDLRERLRVYRWGQRRPVKALAKRFAGQPIDAVAGGMWRGRGWLAAASPAGLELLRRPWVFGRARDVHFPWAELQAVDTGGSGMSLKLTFEGREVKLSALGPPDEYARFVDTARGHLPGHVATAAAEDVRAQARAALGRWRTFEVDASIVALPERLEEGETVEAVAYAVLDFVGLLVITDRRVLLLGRAPRQEPREWSVHRSWVRAAEVVDDGLRLDLGVEVVHLPLVQPEEEREALAARLRPPVTDAPDESDAPPSGASALPEPWTLTAAEAYLLRYLEEGAGVEFPVFRLALIELVARAALRVEPVWVRRRLLPGSRAAWVLAPGPRLRYVQSPALAPLLAAFERRRAERPVQGRAYHDRGRAVEGVRISDLGPDENLTAACVASLVQAGLGTAPLQRTPAGVAADDALETWIRLARNDFPDRISDTAAVRGYLRAAGTTVFLADAAFAALSSVAAQLPDEPWLDVRLGAAANLENAVAAIDAAFTVIKPDRFD